MEERFCLPPLSKALITTHARSFESPSRLARRRIQGKKLACCPNQWRSKSPIALFSFFLVGTTFTGCGANYTATSAGIGSFLASIDTVEFGSVTLGQAVTSSVALVNQSPAAIRVSALSVTGNDFTVMSPSGLPFSVGANGTYTVALQFKPKASGDSNGQLTVTSSSITNSSLKIKLHGKGASVTAPSITSALSSLSCAQGAITGAGNDSCTVTLTSATGTGGFVVSLSSNNRAVTVPSSITVPAGAISAEFTATVTAVTTAESVTLTAVAGSASKTYIVNLGAAAPGLALGATSVSFGTVNLNSLVTQPVILTSSGTAALTISSGSVSGTGFSMSGLSYPLTLNPGQTAILYIQFNPTIVGTASGKVTLTSNAATGSTATINLSGTGEVINYQINLTWNAPVNSPDPVAGYNVYRAAGGSSSYRLLNASVNLSTSFIDTTVQSGSSYSYFVESVDAEGNQSGPSNTYLVSIP